MQATVRTNACGIFLIPRMKNVLQLQIGLTACNEKFIQLQSARATKEIMDDRQWQMRVGLS